MSLSETARSLVILELVAFALLLTAKFLTILPSALVWLAFSLFWLIFTLILFVNAKSRRGLMLFYVEEHSRFRSLLKGGPIMLLGSSIAAMPLALALLIGLACNTASYQWFIVFSLPIILLCFNQSRLFEKTIKAEAIFYLKQRAIFKITAVLSVFLIALLALFFMKIPIASQLNLIDLVNLARVQIQIKDDILQLLAGVYAGLDGLGFFLFQKATSLSLPAIAKLGAALVLTLRSALFILPILIFLQGISWLVITPARNAVRKTLRGHQNA